MKIRRKHYGIFVAVAFGVVVDDVLGERGGMLSCVCGDFGPKLGALVKRGYIGLHGWYLAIVFRVNWKQEMPRIVSHN